MQQKSMAQRAKINLSHVEKRIFKVLGSTVLIKPIQKTLRIREIIDSYCSDDSEITHGQAIEILTTNRLMAPKPLYHVEKWAEDVAVKEVYGILPEKLNDDRLPKISGCHLSSSGKYLGSDSHRGYFKIRYRHKFIYPRHDFLLL